MKHFILISIFILGLGLYLSRAQSINQISIYPSHPSSHDTVHLISDFSYYGNCTYGLVSAAVLQNDSVIEIYPEYCGYGASTLCHAVDTFTMGVLGEGNYNIILEYHQGTVCAGGFDAVIASFDTSLYIGALSVNNLDAIVADVRIYPNPTKDYLNIEINNSESAQIKLLTVSGQLLIEKAFIRQTKLDLTGLAERSYVLMIVNNRSIVSQKIVIE